MSESLITDYSAYQQEYDSKCGKWRSQPIEKRSCNDIACVVIFFIILGVFVGVGAYYIQTTNSNIYINFYVSDRAAQLAICLAIALFFSLIYVFLIKLMPKQMVYALIIITMTLLLGLAIVGFIFSLWGFALTFFIIFIIYGIVLLCFRKKIDMGIILIKVASQFISEKCGVFISPIIKILLTIGFGIFWIYSLSSILSVADEKSANGQSNTTEVVFFYLWFFFWILFGFIFYYMMVFTIAVACSFWYYKVQGKNFLFTSYKWIFTSAFGSIVFASIIIAIITFLRTLVDSRRRQSRNIAAACCLCLVSCCLASIEALLQILNHNCVIVMSVTGQNYIDSAKTTIGILSRFLSLLIVADIISSFVLFWGMILVGGLIALISYLWLSARGVIGGELIVLIIIAVFASLLVASLVFSVLTQGVSAVFIFYCFDVKFREMGYTANNMPLQINRQLDNYGREEDQ